MIFPDQTFDEYNVYLLLTFAEHPFPFLVTTPQFSFGQFLLYLTLSHFANLSSLCVTCHTQSVLTPYE